jgi:hypothetical protein
MFGLDWPTKEGKLIKAQAEKTHQVCADSSSQTPDFLGFAKFISPNLAYIPAIRVSIEVAPRIDRGQRARL